MTDAKKVFEVYVFLSPATRTIPIRDPASMTLGVLWLSFKLLPSDMQNTNTNSKIKPTDDDYMATFALQRSIQVKFYGQVQNFGWDPHNAPHRIPIK